MVSAKKIGVVGAGGDGRVIAETVRHAQAAGTAIVLRGFLDDGLAVPSLTMSQFSAGSQRGLTCRKTSALLPPSTRSRT
jgi:hypothetical protein